jgi:acetyltransferase-like isoleucine patch superfamily enzyme
MANDDRTKIIPGRTPESAAMLANVKRAMAITADLNRLTFNDADQVRALFSDLIGKKVDDSFLLIPPFYTTGGVDISIGRNVFVNQNCTFYDLGGLDIADDVMIGPNVSIICCCGGFRSHQERSPQYSCRRKPGEGHSFDCRLRARLSCVSQNSPIFDLKSLLQQS